MEIVSKNMKMKTLKILRKMLKFMNKKCPILDEDLLALLMVR